MVVWKGKTGPLGGSCPECKGRMTLHYHGGTVSEYVCSKCGLTLSYGGVYSSPDNTTIKHIVDECWKALKVDRVDVKTFATLVDKVSLKTNNGQIHVLKSSELTSWGYQVDAGFIYKR